MRPGVPAACATAAPRIHGRQAPRPGIVRSLLAGVALLFLSGCAAPGAEAFDSPAAGDRRRERIGGEAAATILATVGARTITALDLESAILDRYYGGGALLGLIRESLFRQEAERLGVAVDPNAVDTRVEQEIDSIFGPAGEERSRQEAAWAARGLRAEELRRSIRRETENLLLVECVAKALREVGESHLQTLYERTYRRARAFVRHIALPFHCAGTPSAGHAEAVRSQAEHLAQTVRNGGNFAMLAAEHSGNPETAARGGEMGWIDEGVVLDPELIAAIFALRAGEVSAPTREGDYGWHIFLVEQRLEAKPLEQVRGELGRILAEAPPTPEEIAAVEELLRVRIPVAIRELPVRTPK